MDRKKIVLAILCVGFMIASGLLLVGSGNVSPPLKARIATATGDTYAASHTANGDWYIYAPTVYDGTDETCYGNLTIVSGGLTFRNAVLTFDMATQYEHIVILDSAYLNVSNSILRVSNGSSATEPWMNITALPGGGDANIYISNSTVKHFDVIPYDDGDYIDNSTFHASKIDCVVGGLYQTRINISYNHFDSLTTGQAITGGFPLNSNITGNTIEANCSQSYQAGAPGWINVLGPYSGQSRGTKVIKNHIEATVHYTGIFLYEPNLINVSRNIIDKVARNSNGTDLAGINAGIFMRGEGLWSTIDNNTIKRITGDPLLGGYSGFNIGIAAFIDSIHWNIFYNKIWRVGSAENNSCLGIDYEGSHANIKGNNFTYVGLDQGPAYINTAGIIVENNYLGVYAGLVTNALHCEYVNSTYNVVDRVQQASNGITYGWALVGHNVTKGIIAYNTIGTTYTGSGGIGVYLQATHIQVLHNTITAVHHDSYGIGVAANVSYITVSNNSIHVVSLDLTNYVGNYYGEGVTSWSEAAIMMGSELTYDSLKYSVFSYNHITIDDRSNGPGLLPYSDYIIHYCSNLTPTNSPTFIITEPANFVWVNSTFKVTVIPPSGYSVQFLLNGVTSSYTLSGGSFNWRTDSLSRSYRFLNVTETLIQTNSPSTNINAAFTFKANGLKVNFQDNSQGHGIYKWIWDFGDLSTSTKQDPSHTYAKPGTYRVILTVMNADGFSDTITKTVTVSGIAAGPQLLSLSTMLAFGLMFAGAVIIIALRRPAAIIVGVLAFIFGILLIFFGL